MRTCPNLPKQNECDRTKNGARDYNGGIGGYRGHSISNWGDLANCIASECYRNVIRKKIIRKCWLAATAHWRVGKGEKCQEMNKG